MKDNCSDPPKFRVFRPLQGKFVTRSFPQNIKKISNTVFTLDSNVFISISIHTRLEADLYFYELSPKGLHSE